MELDYKATCAVIEALELQIRIYAEKERDHDLSEDVRSDLINDKLYLECLIRQIRDDYRVRSAKPTEVA